MKCSSHKSQNAVLGKTRCQRCLDKMKEWNKKDKVKKIASGLCICHKDRKAKHGHIVCQKCLDNALERTRNLRKVWSNYLEKRGLNKCSKCGYNKCQDAIEFHHNNKDEKEFGISKLKKRKITKQVILELEKCTPLCANCHREVHSTQVMT